MCVCLWGGHTEIFQCFLSAREVARSRDRERSSSSAPGARGAAEDEPMLSQEGRRGSGALPEGQDLYTAACNSVIHRCALLLLGVSPVLGELSKQNQEEGQTQSASGTQECLSFMTRSRNQHRRTFLIFVDVVLTERTCICVLLTSRSESLSAESRLVQSSPSYRLMKSRSESDLSQPESDEEGYTLVRTAAAGPISRLVFEWKVQACSSPLL